MDISRWLAHRADWSPGRVALSFEGGELTYAELDRRARRAAAALVGLGVGDGDRVAFLGYNSPVLIELLFAAARIGAIVVPLNWRLTVAELAFIVADAAPRLLVAEAEFHHHAAQLAGGVARLVAADSPPAADGQRWASYTELRDRAGEPPAVVGDLARPLLLVYTSGTTGQPKGAVLTQGALFWNAVNSIAACDITSADHALTVLPLFHVGGLNIHTTPALMAGATVTLTRRFDPSETLTLIEARRPTLFLAVPAVALAVSRHARFARADLSSLRGVWTGSSTVPEAVMRPWLDRGVPVTQIYGLTESGPTALALPLADARRKLGSCGKPALFCEARVVDTAGRDAPAGERGEIWLRGPNLIAGYWNAPAATAEAFEDGWLRTGDIGHRDAEGYYYIDDRKKDVVISGGENVYPAELENVLSDCPDIAESAVVGQPDAEWGEVPVACVVPRPGAALTRERVLALFDGRLARYKHPRTIVFLDALPRTAMGKVQKFALRRLLGR